MNVPFNTAAQGWQCPCCKTIYAPAVQTCFPCSGGGARTTYVTDSLPLAQPIVVPTVLWNGPVNPDGSPAPIGEFKAGGQC